MSAVIEVTNARLDPGISKEPYSQVFSATEVFFSTYWRFTSQIIIIIIIISELK